MFQNIACGNTLDIPEISYLTFIVVLFNSGNKKDVMKTLEFQKYDHIIKMESIWTAEL